MIELLTSEANRMLGMPGPEPDAASTYAVEETGRLLGEWGAGEGERLGIATLAAPLEHHGGPFVGAIGLRAAARDIARDRVEYATSDDRWAESRDEHAEEWADRILYRPVEEKSADPYEGPGWPIDEDEVDPADHLDGLGWPPLG